MTQYRLTRTTPRGEVRASSGTFRRVRDAVTRAVGCLYDNGAASKTEANRFGNELHNMPIGTELAHASGYVFRIDKAA